MSYCDGCGESVPKEDLKPHESPRHSALETPLLCPECHPADKPEAWG